MAAVVVNQNNIVDIVKSTLDIMASISTVISNATLFCAHLKINIDVVDNAITQIFGDNGEGGVVGRVREINETLTNKRFYRSFMRNHIKKAISLQFNEIKDLIELIKEVADEAQGIDKGIINTIHYVMTSMVDIFDLTKKIPLNPLIGVRLEHAHLILYLIKIHILRPIRIIGLSFYRSYKNTLIGVAVLKLIAHVFMPCIADLVTAVNSVSILKYTTSLIGLSLIGANLKSMFKIITILGRKRLNPNNILKIAVISAVLKGVIQIMVDLVKSVPLIKTIVSLKLGVWETLGEILKQIFNIFSDISKRN